MAYPSKPRLSAREKASTVFRLLVLAPFILPFNIARACLLALLHGDPIRHYSTVGLYRTLLTLLTHRQAQALLPSCIAAYRSWIFSQQKLFPPPVSTKLFSPDVDPIPSTNGASSLLWIGDRHTAKRFVLLLHGGGFYLPLDKGHLQWGLSFIRSCSTGEELEDADVAVAVMDYSLAPQEVYPTQLGEVSLALKYLIEKVKVRPGNLLVGGDSAGGTLTAQLLSHLVRPHPKGVEIELEEPLAGAFLVSPWVGGCCHESKTVDPSWEENHKRDMLTLEVTKELERIHFKGTEWEQEKAEGKGWGLPLDVDAEWLRGTEKAVKRVYVTVGEVETLRDQGVEYAKRLSEETKGTGLDVKLDVLKGQGHEFIVLEAGSGKGGPALEKMNVWARSAFMI